MYHIVINPASRSGKGFRIWNQQVEPALKKEGVVYQSYFSKKAGDIAALVQHIFATATERPIKLIVLGGDGTVNEALQGMPDTSQVILGYIPTGSSNDLARDLNIPKDATRALDMILHHGHSRPMDLATLTYEDGTKRHFAVSCGIGYDAAVCEEVAHSSLKNFFNKIGLGKLTYLGIALKQLISTKNVSCQLFLDDNAPIAINNMLLITGMLHRFEGGGFMFCPDAADNDGIMDFCAVGGISKLLILYALPTAFKGKHYKFKGITPYRAKCMRIEASSPLWVHTDGEVERRCCSFSVTCIPDAIRVMVP